MADDKTPNDAPSVNLEPTSVRPPSSVPVSLGSLGATSPAEANPDYLPPGTQVGLWTIESKLGAGGMGAVYLVKSTQTEPATLAALKLSLAPKEESPNERTARIKRFEREFGAVFLLDHDNIVKPFSFFCWPDPLRGHPCIVMPVVQGATLSAYCRTKHPPLRVLLRDVLAPIADALDYIHSKGLCHRDIKPANIMVREDGVPLLMDFGIARSRASSTLTSTEVLTTYEFGAPEYLAYIASAQRFSEIPFDYRPEADLFCLGAAFFDVLTGHLPYQHVAGVGDPLAYMSEVFQSSLKTFAPIAVSSLNPAVPIEIDELLRRLMDRDPAQRFGAGGDVVEAIDELIASVAPSPQWDEPFVPPPRARVTKAQSSSAGRKRSSRPASLSKPTSVDRPPLGPPAVPPPSVAAQPPQVILEPVSDVRLPAPSFVSPVSAVAAPAVQKANQLPSAILAARERLQAAGTNSTRSRTLVIAGVGLAAIVLGIVIVASLDRPPTAKPQSLLDEKHEASAPLAPPVQLEPQQPSSETTDMLDASVTLAAVVPSTTAALKSVKRGSNPDAVAINAMLDSEFGGSRPTVGGKITPSVAKKSSWVQGAEEEEAPKQEATKSLGIPTGTEIGVRLMKPLDSRTIGSGPAVARLMRPLVMRGAVALPTGTMIYGSATTTGAGRFDVQFTKLKLPDGRELEFAGLAYDADDKRPGLRASSRIQGTAGKSQGLGEKLVRGTANTMLGKIDGEGGADLAKGAGQTVINHAEDNAGAQNTDAIVLEAPADFVVFITSAL
ncbi:MAG: protein kinase [Archangium sp.]